MIFDSHTHTTMSTDGRMKIQDVIQRTEKLNIGAILTEHLDLAYKENDVDFRLNIPLYFQKYEQYRNDKLLLGIEIGLAERVYSQNKKIAEKNPFDFIIGSIHEVYGFEIGYDYKPPQGDKNKMYEEYFECQYKMICENLFFHSLGHIDYPARYYEGKFTYKNYPEHMDRIFRKLIENGQVLELNTKRFYDKQARKELFDIYKRYKELGGQSVTIGSDAHYKEYIYQYFDMALEMVHELGLQVVHFRKGMKVASE